VDTTPAGVILSTEPLPLQATYRLPCESNLRSEELAHVEAKVEGVPVVGKLPTTAAVDVSPLGETADPLK
jgi:hypothetical protein